MRSYIFVYDSLFCGQAQIRFLEMFLLWRGEKQWRMGCIKVKVEGQVCALLHKSWLLSAATSAAVIAMQKCLQRVFH